MSEGPPVLPDTMTEDQAEQRQIGLVLSIAMSDHSGERLSIPEFLRQAEQAGIPPDLRWPTTRISNHLGHGQVARVMIEGGLEISQNSFKESLKKYGLSQGTSEHLARFVSALKGWAAKERQATTREQLATRIPHDIPVSAETVDDTGESRSSRSGGGGGSSSRSIPNNDNAIERGLALVQSAVEREVRQLRADHEVQLDRILKIQQDRLDDVRSTTAVALEEMKTNFRDSLSSKDQVIKVLQNSRKSDRILLGLLTILTLTFGLIAGAVILAVRPGPDTKPVNSVPVRDPVAGGGSPTPTIIELPVTTSTVGLPTSTPTPTSSSTPPTTPTPVPGPPTPSVAPSPDPSPVASPVPANLTNPSQETSP